jgi:hypothetical protein
MAAALIAGLLLWGFSRLGSWLVVTLKEIVPDYSPSAHLLRRVVVLGAKQMVVTAG